MKLYAVGAKAALAPQGRKSTSAGDVKPGKSARLAASLAHMRCIRGPVHAAEMARSMSGEVHREFAKLAFQMGFASNVREVGGGFYVENILSVSRELLVGLRKSSECDALASFGIAKDLGLRGANTDVLFDSRNGGATVALAMSVIALRDVFIGIASLGRSAACDDAGRSMVLRSAAYNEETLMSAVDTVREVVRDIAWLDSACAAKGRLDADGMGKVELAVLIVGVSLLGACAGSKAAARAAASCSLIVDFVAGVVGSGSRTSSRSVRSLLRMLNPGRLLYLRTLVAMNLQVEKRLQVCRDIASVYVDTGRFSGPESSDHSKLRDGGAQVAACVIEMISQGTSTDVAYVFMREVNALKYGVSATGGLIGQIALSVCALIRKQSLRVGGGIAMREPEYSTQIRELCGTLKAVVGTSEVGDDEVLRWVLEVVEAVNACFGPVSSVDWKPEAGDPDAVFGTPMGTVLGAFDVVRCASASTVDLAKLSAFLRKEQLAEMFLVVRRHAVPIVGGKLERAIADLEDRAKDTECSPWW